MRQVAVVVLIFCRPEEGETVGDEGRAEHRWRHLVDQTKLGTEDSASDEHQREGGKYAVSFVVGSML